MPYTTEPLDGPSPDTHPDDDRGARIAIERLVRQGVPEHVIHREVAAMAGAEPPAGSPRRRLRDRLRRPRVSWS